MPAHGITHMEQEGQVAAAPPPHLVAIKEPRHGQDDEERDSGHERPDEEIGHGAAPASHASSGSAGPTSAADTLARDAGVSPNSVSISFARRQASAAM